MWDQLAKLYNENLEQKNTAGPKKPGKERELEEQQGCGVDIRAA